MLSSPVRSSGAHEFPINRKFLQLTFLLHWIGKHIETMKSPYRVLLAFREQLITKNVQQNATSSSHASWFRNSGGCSGMKDPHIGTCLSCTPVSRSRSTWFRWLKDHFYPPTDLDYLLVISTTRSLDSLHWPSTLLNQEKERRSGSPVLVLVGILFTLTAQCETWVVIHMPRLERSTIWLNSYWSCYNLSMSRKSNYNVLFNGFHLTLQLIYSSF